jgi:hypothetical protein
MTESPEQGRALREMIAEQVRLHVKERFERLEERMDVLQQEQQAAERTLISGLEVVSKRVTELSVEVAMWPLPKEVVEAVELARANGKYIAEVSQQLGDMYQRCDALYQRCDGVAQLQVEHQALLQENRCLLDQRGLELERSREDYQGLHQNLQTLTKLLYRNVNETQEASASSPLCERVANLESQCKSKADHTEMLSLLAGKASVDHTHNDLMAEMHRLLAQKAPLDHSHDCLMSADGSVTFAL